MIKRCLKLLLESFAIFLAGLTVLLVLAAGRLSMGPVPLNFLNPYIEDGLSTADGGYTVRLEETILTWAGWDRTLDILARGVRVTNAAGAEQAVVPELSISLSLRALLDGRLAPTQLEFFRPRLHLVRTAEGRLKIGDSPSPAGDEAPETPGFRGELAEKVVLGLMSPPEPGRPLGYLTSVSVSGADLMFTDKREGISWRSPGTSIVLSRDEDGIGGNARLNIRTDGTSARVEVSGGYSASRAAVDLEVRFRDLHPARLAKLGPALEPLAGLRLPVAGRVLVRAGTGDGLRELMIDISAGPGTVAVPRLDLAPVAVSRASLRANVTGDFERVEVTALTADLHGPRLALTGTARRRDGGYEADLEAAARDVGTADLKRLWPRGVAEGGRSWIAENLENGMIPEVKVSAGLDVDTAAESGPEVAVRSLDGSFGFRGVDVHYLKPLPPVRGISGTGTLSPGKIVIEADHGRLGKLDVSEGRIRLHDLETTDHKLALEIVARGPVGEALSILDHPRLALLGELGFGPESVRGQAAARLVADFPLLKELTFEQMDLAAAANLKQVVLRGAAFGVDLTDGDLRLQLDKRGMDVTGTARIAGVAAEIDWTENFYAGARYRSRYAVKGEVGASARRRLGFETAPYVTGPVGVDLILTRLDDARSDLTASLDLKRATFALDELKWSKPPGTAGFARLSMALENGTVRSIDRLTVRAADLMATGSVTIGPADRGVESFRLSRLAFGGTDLAVEGRVGPEGGLALDLSGPALDIRPYLEAERAEAGDDGPGRPLDLSVNVDAVRITDGPALTRVAGTLSRRQGQWQRVDLSGQVGAGKTVTFRITPSEEGRRLAITADDAGAALKSLDVTENMVGGTLSIAARFDDTRPDNPLTGKFDARRFQMVRAPLLAKLLSVASLTGILDALSGQGISFQRAVVPFTKTGDRLAIGEARAYGSAVGFTAHGVIDVGADTLDLNGTIVPAYTLNSVFGNIPLLGPLLIGEKGSGVFAATYRMRGKLENPDVSVNPLATLTPGFLRGLFDIFDAPRETPPSEPAGEEKPAKTPDEASPAPAPAP